MDWRPRTAGDGIRSLTLRPIRGCALRPRVLRTHPAAGCANVQRVESPNYIRYAYRCRGIRPNADRPTRLSGRWPVLNDRADGPRVSWERATATLDAEQG